MGNDGRVKRLRLHPETVKGEPGAREFADQVAYLERRLSPTDRTQPDAREGSKINAGRFVKPQAIEVFRPFPALKNRKPWDFGREVAKIQVVLDRPSLMFGDRQTSPDKLKVSDSSALDNGGLTHPVLNTDEVRRPELAEPVAGFVHELAGLDRPAPFILEFGESPGIQSPGPYRAVGRFAYDSPRLLLRAKPGRGKEQKERPSCKTRSGYSFPDRMSRSTCAVVG